MMVGGIRSRPWLILTKFAGSMTMVVITYGLLGSRDGIVYGGPVSVATKMVS